MFKKLLILLLVLRMTMPVGAEEKIFKSLSDQGDQPVVVQSRPTLIPVPEVPPVPTIPKDISIEFYPQAMSVGTINPLVCTKVIKIGNKIATGLVIDTDSGCPYVVTCGHVVNGIDPKDVIYFDKYADGAIVSKSQSLDLAVVEFKEDIGPGVPISEYSVKVGDTITVIGGDGTPENKITTTTHKVVFTDDNSFFCDGPLVLGRSGAGAYVNDELVGVFCGVVGPTSKETKLIGKQIYTRASRLVPLLTPVQYPITFYSGATCRFCRQQHEITDAVNDKRIVATWSEERCPDFILKNLTLGYQLPVPTWPTDSTHWSWPQQWGVHSIDELVSLCEQSKAPGLKATNMVMGGRWRNQQQQQPVGSVECAQQIDQLYGWFDDYLKNGATGRALLHRSGARTFNLYGGKATDLKLETLLGKTGGLELSIVYPDGTPENIKLPVRELKFGFMFDEDDIIFTVDSVRVIGLVKMVDGKIASLQMKDGEQAKGFIGILTLLSILSYIHTIYVLLHPVADIELGGEIAVSAQRVDNDNVVINFEKGKQPFVKIRSLMTFNLGINQILINKAAKTIIPKFDGTIFAKQYTLHYK